jgi:hypothetical protein
MLRPDTLDAAQELIQTSAEYQTCAALLSSSVETITHAPPSARRIVRVFDQKGWGRFSVLAGLCRPHNAVRYIYGLL